MILTFSNRAKKLKKAWETNDFHTLEIEYDSDTAACIADVLNLLNSARNLHDVKPFKQYRPHTIEGGSVFSLSLVGRKRLTIRTLDAQGKQTKKVDFSATGSIILEVTEHYGD